jgi:hypothetical protein
LAICSNLDNDGRWLHHHWLGLHHHRLDGLHHWLLGDVNLSGLSSCGNLLSGICRLLAAAVTANADKDDNEDKATDDTTDNGSEHAFG